MSWFRCTGISGGTQSDQFMWNAYDKNWTAKSVSVGASQTLRMVCETISPVLVSGCRLRARIQCYASSTQTSGLSVSTDGVEWSALIAEASGGVHNYDVDLTPYFGLNLYFRFYCFNGDVGTKTFTLQYCYIEKVL